jgi:hypothetical protein
MAGPCPRTAEKKRNWAPRLRYWHVSGSVAAGRFDFAVLKAIFAGHIVRSLPLDDVKWP